MAKGKNQKPAGRKQSKGDAIDFQMPMGLLGINAPNHIRFKKWTKKEIVAELEALRLWLSDPHPLNITFERFAVSRGYSRQRISEWAKAYPKNQKIQELYQICRDIQTNKYFVGGLTRIYSEQLSKFGLINCCGLKPEVTHVIAGDPERPVPVGTPQAVQEYLDRLEKV